MSLKTIKILDKYLIKQFLQSVLFGLIAFVVIFAIIDMMENLDDFIDHDVSNALIVEYYIVFIPEIIRLMLPVAVLLGSLFTVGRLSNLNELTAIKSSGVSVYRFMVPFVVTAFFISLFTIYFGGDIVPRANKRKVYIEQVHMKKNVVRAGNNIFFQDSPTRIVTIFYYDVINDQANRVSIQEYDKDDLTKMVTRIDAVKMRYDSTQSGWTLFDGTRREFGDSTETANQFKKMFLADLNFSPSDVIKKQRKPEEMTLGELDEYAEDQLRTGNDPTRISIEYHSRIAFAFTSLIIVFFGLPFSVNRRKGGMAIQFGISTLITFIYLAFMKISQAFGKNGVMDPIFTAWFANIIFAAAAVVSLIKAKK